MQKQSNPLPPAKGTLDEKHTEMLNQFHVIETETIPNLQIKKKELKTRMKSLPKNQIDAFMDLKDQIQNISQQIKTLKSLKKRYLLDNSRHIFDYFEQKKKVSSGDNGQNVNVLNSFFKIKAKNDEASTIAGPKYNQSKNTYHAYWKNINHSIFNIQDFVVPSDI
jgi:hypothetical protein